MSNVRGLVKINGKDYRINPNSWASRDIVDFAPRATTPGGSIVHSELGLYQPLLQQSWQHGFGFVWHTDGLGYAQTEGEVDTRHDGLVMLFTQPTASDNDNYTKSGAIYFNGYLFTWGPNGVRRYSSGSGWEAVDIGVAGAVNFMFTNGTYLFAFPDGARIKKSSTGGKVLADWTDAGANTNASDFKWATISKGYVYAGKDGKNEVYRASANDLSDLYGVPADDPNVIYVGSGLIPTINGAAYAEQLFVPRQDGLFAIGDDDIARTKLSFADQSSTSNFLSMAVFQGFLWFPIRNRIFQWNGARLADLTPNRITDDFPFITYGKFTNFVAVGRFMFLTARTNESTYRESILCFDGVGWHKLLDPITDGDGSITMMFYDATNDRLWYHVQRATSNSTSFIPFQTLSEFPYANFPTTGVHRVYSSRYEMGFRWVEKSSPSFVVEGQNLTTDRFLRIYYSLDGGAFVQWGDITQDGTTTLDLPSGKDTIEYAYIQVAVEFHTADAAQSPILKGTTLRFIMRPDVAYGYNFDIVVASHAPSGEGGHMVDPRAAHEIIRDLRAARASKAPIELVTIADDTVRGYISALNEMVVGANMDENEGGKPGLEYIVRANFVELS